MEFTFDHTGFYHGEKRFHPRIQETALPLQEWSNTVLLALPANLREELDWTQEKLRAIEGIAAGKQILWEIDLGLSTSTFLRMIRRRSFRIL